MRKKGATWSSLSLKPVGLKNISKNHQIKWLVSLLQKLLKNAIKATNRRNHTPFFLWHSGTREQLCKAKTCWIASLRKTAASHSHSPANTSLRDRMHSTRRSLIWARPVAYCCYCCCWWEWGWGWRRRWGWGCWWFTILLAKYIISGTMGFRGVWQELESSKTKFSWLHLLYQQASSCTCSPHTRNIRETGKCWNKIFSRKKGRHPNNCLLQACHAVLCASMLSPSPIKTFFSCQLLL